MLDNISVSKSLIDTASLLPFVPGAGERGGDCTPFPPATSFRLSERQSPTNVLPEPFWTANVVALDWTPLERLSDPCEVRWFITPMKSRGRRISMPPWVDVALTKIRWAPRKDCRFQEKERRG